MGLSPLKSYESESPNEQNAVEHPPSFCRRPVPVAAGRSGGRRAATDPARRDAAALSGRLQWWAEARFGMFIHWGPVSLKGTEISWSRANTNPKCPNRGTIPAAVYDNLYKDFNPTQFDAAQWVGVAKAAGAKYIVLTAKHCDGFLLWHSQVSDYNISAHAVPAGHLRRAGQGRARGRASASAGISRRWTGAIPISAPSATRRSSAGCRRNCASC